MRDKVRRSRQLSGAGKSTEANSRCITRRGQALVLRLEACSSSGFMSMAPSAGQALVRARHHFQRAVGGVAVVEVNADGNNVFQDFDRRLHRHTFGLTRPGAETGQISAAVHFYHQVLVLGHQPVRTGGLVEVNGFRELAARRAQPSQLLPQSYVIE